MPGFNLPFVIQVVDCATATMTVPAARTPQTQLFDDSTFEMKVSLADFAFSNSQCQIDHYLISCTDFTDFGGKTKNSKCTKQDDGSWPCLIEQSDGTWLGADDSNYASDSKCNFDEFQTDNTDPANPVRDVFANEASFTKPYENYGQYSYSVRAGIGTLTHVDTYDWTFTLESKCEDDFLKLSDS